MRLRSKPPDVIRLPDVADADASTRAARRDVAAASRDAAADRRDLTSDDTPGRAAGDRACATADRAAAAEDRRLSAVDRDVSAVELRTAYRDDLTGALLRDAGREQLLQALDRAQRCTSPLALAFLDVDALKNVNDTRGHAAGDAVLSAVGAALEAGLRSYDVVVRWGGDEFVCALPDCGEAEARQRFASVAASLTGLTGVSVGIVVPTPDEDLDLSLGRADAAMYATRTP